MSARVLLMNSKKSLLSGSLSLSKRHNHQTMNRSPQHCHQATRQRFIPSSERKVAPVMKWGLVARGGEDSGLCSYQASALLIFYYLLYYLLLYTLSSTLLFFCSYSPTPLTLFTSCPIYHLPCMGNLWWSCTIFPQVMVGNLIMYHLEQANKKSPVKQKWSFHLAQVGTGGGMWALGELGVPKMESITGINQTAWEGRRVVTYGF